VESERCVACILARKLRECFRFHKFRLYRFNRFNRAFARDASRG
jgi:hypothetical protein